MHTPIRVGAVNYLNTKPLIYDLEALAPEAELRLEVPSRLADLLQEGELYVALIPVIEYFRAGNYSVVPDISIASNGPVLSVTLFSRTPWTGIRKLFDLLHADVVVTAAPCGDSLCATRISVSQRVLKTWPFSSSSRRSSGWLYISPL